MSPSSPTRRTLAAAWLHAGDPDGGAWSAAVARRRADRAQADVLRTGVQVLGAMGLTMESEMHRHVTRGAALDLLLGGHAELAERTGRALLDGAAAQPVATI